MQFPSYTLMFMYLSDWKAVFEPNLVSVRSSRFTRIDADQPIKRGEKAEKCLPFRRSKLDKGEL